MQSIISDGAPFIVLHENCALDWKGIFGNGSIASQMSFEHDYEALCNICLSTLPSHFGVVEGPSGPSLMLTHPYETAIVFCDNRSVLLSQIMYADEGFGFNSIDRGSVVELEDMEEKFIDLAAGHYYVINAANAFDSVEGEMLSFKIEGGRCRIMSGTFGDPERFLAALTLVSPVDRSR